MVHIHSKLPHDYLPDVPMGPEGCIWCCDSCNLDTHKCGAYGQPLRHDGTERDTQLEHDCLSEED